MIPRRQLIEILESHNIRYDEYYYKHLEAPPISYFISVRDLAYLNEIATSLKYAARPEFKFKEIDHVMEYRGFYRLGSGTNRLCYYYVESPLVVSKIAFCDVGLKDGPREFINQRYTYPFNSKIFEADPSGTMTLAERGNQITNRDQFESISDMTYLITRYFLTGKYVMDDIGTNYYMNWATRPFDGCPMLVDFPYIYELDHRKLVCNKYMLDGSICGGIIDYDAGYNVLRCQKCGAKYRAIELAKSIENNQITLTGSYRKRTRGGAEMKYKIKVTGNDGNSQVYQVGGIPKETKSIQAQYEESDKAIAEASKALKAAAAVRPPQGKPYNPLSPNMIIGVKDAPSIYTPQKETIVLGNIYKDEEKKKEESKMEGVNTPSTPAVASGIMPAPVIKDSLEAKIENEDTTNIDSVPEEVKEKKEEKVGIVENPIVGEAETPVMIQDIPEVKEGASSFIPKKPEVTIEVKSPKQYNPSLNTITIEIETNDGQENLKEEDTSEEIDHNPTIIVNDEIDEEDMEGTVMVDQMNSSIEISPDDMEENEVEPIVEAASIESTEDSGTKEIESAESEEMPDDEDDTEIFITDPIIDLAARYIKVCYAKNQDQDYLNELGRIEEVIDVADDDLAESLQNYVVAFVNAMKDNSPYEPTEEEKAEIKASLNEEMAGNLAGL